MFSGSLRDWIFGLTALAGIVGVVLASLSVPPRYRRTAFLLTYVLVGAGLVASLWDASRLIFTSAITGYFAVLLIGTTVFAFRMGQNSEGSIADLEDVVHLQSSRPDAYAWTSGALEDSKPPIHLDAMGVNLDSIYRILRSTGPKVILPQGVRVQSRILILKAGSPGAIQRASIEGHDKVLHDAEAYCKLWKDLLHSQADSDSALQRLEVKTFSFCPAFYVIRVNNRIFAGTYISGPGYDGFTLLLDNKDGSVFRQFSDLFDNVWNRASSPLDLPSEDENVQP